MDPVSIAGLALAIFDQIWKLGERTAALVSDYQDFHKDAKVIETYIRDEINRTKTLRVLLFQPCKVYHDDNLFDQFGEDVQSQVFVLLEDLKELFKEAETVAENQCVPSLSPRSLTPVSLSSSTGSLTLRPPQTIQRKASDTFRRWKWVFYEKDRFEKIVRKITKANRRVHDNVQLWCHATALGVDPDHMRHLRDDAISKQLGFDRDATLQLLVCDATFPTASLEIKYPVPKVESSEVSALQDRVTTCLWEGKRVLVEFRGYAPIDAGPQTMNERKRELVQKLATLLHEPKELSFRAPDCIGWYMDTSLNSVGLVFDLPQDVEIMPRSLLQILEQPNKTSLSDRLQLAHALSLSISRMQMVRWVHESFRSDNILFITAGIREPWLLGFANSRPEEAFSSGRSDGDITRNLYRHPSRQGVPSQTFRKIHDVYALGVVLLEIGLWKPVISMERDRFRRVQDGTEIKKHLIKVATKGLPICMGEKYKDVVIACLTSNFGVDDTENLAFQRAFRTQVADILGKAATSM